MPDNAQCAEGEPVRSKERVRQTTESLRSQDGEYENYHYQLDDGEQYALTDGEVNWLYQFVLGRYAIADHLIENIEETDSGDFIYTVDTLGLGQALSDDGTFPKAVMLSDDSALQAVIFYSSDETD